jgi:hypothetical protein
VADGKSIRPVASTALRQKQDGVDRWFSEAATDRVFTATPDYSAIMNKKGKAGLKKPEKEKKKFTSDSR